MKKQIFTLSLLLLFGVGLSAQPKTVGEPRVIAKTNEPLQRPVWSPDGAKLLLNNGQWEVSAVGTNLKRVETLRATSPQKTNPLLQQMIDAPANVTSQIKSLQSLSGCLIFNPVLSPQGDKIVFQADKGKGLFVINADGSGLRSLGQGERATWTPDGKYIVVMIVGDDGHTVTKGELVSIQVATGAKSSLFANSKYIALSPAISPDGKKLAFEEYSSGVIYIMDIQ